MLLSMQILGFIISYITYLVRPGLLYGLYSRLLMRFVTRTPYPNVKKDFPEAIILENNIHRIRAEIMTYCNRASFAISDNIGLPAVLTIKDFSRWNQCVSTTLPFTTDLLQMIPMAVRARIVLLGKGYCELGAAPLFKGMVVYLLPLTASNEGTLCISSGRWTTCNTRNSGVAIDDTFPHVILNNSDDRLLVLSLDVQRMYSLPRWAQGLNHVMIYLLSRSRRVQRAVEELEFMMTRKVHSITRYKPVLES